ncbi:AAA family ATPase [Methanococcoides methylutens]|uniref:DNA double-strand break repair Rad50 ATPase n=1 Tax=Methanococcoides methylutens MM1 TaxID=1434104 RepID=A0A0E3X1C7_METMT|nr:AAA family ATPase [Methanococcoides methylutens]AKB86065.1 Exonuclease SbcC [Methanococcoides methylutens MM1]
MKLKRLRVNNIRSYEDLDIRFEDGVTVVSGVNGSGKSSLLEACFTGLFGSRTLSKEFVLSDLIRKGATKASIIVDFESIGHEYNIEQGYRVNPKTGSASNNKSVFMMDDKIMVDQASQTYEAVKALMKMDEEAYKNCVYIRQGEIDVLINAKTKDRQRMIDDLLQIGKLEEYRERAGSARKGVGRHQRETDARLKDNVADIEHIESSNPYQMLNTVKTEMNGVGNEISELEDKKDRAKEIVTSIEEKINKYTGTLEQKKTIDAEVRNFKSKITATYNDIEKARGVVNSGRQEVQKLQSVNTDLCTQIKVPDDADVENYVTSLEKEESAARDEVSTIIKKRELAQGNERSQNEFLLNLNEQLKRTEVSIQNREAKAKSITEDIEKLKKGIIELEDANREKTEEASKIGFPADKLENIEDIAELLGMKQKQLHGKEREKAATLAELDKRIKKAKDLLDKGLCPTCGQDLKGSKICEETTEDEEQRGNLLAELQSIRSEQSELETKTERVRSAREIAKGIADNDHQIQIKTRDITSSEKLIEENLRDVKEEKEKENALKEQIDEVGKVIGKIKEDIVTLKEDENDATESHKAIKDRLDIARRIRMNHLEIGKMQSDMQRSQDGISNGLEKVNLFEDQIKERKKRLEAIEKELGDVDITRLENDKVQYESAHKGIISRLEDLNLRKNELHKQVGLIEGEIRRLNELKEKHRMLSNKKEFLAAVYRDAEELETMYIRLRAELRAKNIDALDRLLNEIFSFMYTNNAYSHISLDQDYNLMIYEKDGTPLEPKLLSGGERAIFNLVLRCAIYRLLSHSPGTTGSVELPPLILDEPTVFLDRGHVHQLIKLIDMMRDIGVGQILIVSHDESLIDSADHVFVVEKDAITNSSSIAAK